MSETENIAKIADKVSSELFGIFGWTSCRPMNQNWACDLRESHRRKGNTHASDVVFFYDDPYDAGFVYITVDLKSYAKNSIGKEKVADAVRTLVTATACADLSEDFAALYVADHGAHRWTAVGLLFVYNRDGEYEGDFDRLLSQIAPENYHLPANRRVFILGPAQIAYLHTIARDIVHQRGLGNIPPQDQCHFYYPDLVRLPARVSKEAKAASLEWLTGPWQIFRFHPSGNADFSTKTFVYYRDSGTSTDEFKYLIDYLFRYQLIDVGNIIEIRAVPAKVGLPSAKPIFEKAKVEYVFQSHPATRDDFTSRLQNVRYSTVETLVPIFDEREIGTRDE